MKMYIFYGEKCINSVLKMILIILDLFFVSKFIIIVIFGGIGGVLLLIIFIFIICFCYCLK